MSDASAPAAAAMGMSGADLEAWLHFNLPNNGEWPPAGQIAPFPPVDLMRATTGLTEPAHFASHGIDFIRALSAASPVPLRDYTQVLDFGVGVGRVARLFHGFEGRYVGVDVDPNVIDWVSGNLAHVKAVLTVPRRPLPMAGRDFDAVISISVFSHMCESDHLFYLEELARVTRPGAVLMLSIHGERALERAMSEPPVFEMLSIPRLSLNLAQPEMTHGRGFAFIRQDGHLSGDNYDYGITFISEAYVRSTWSQMFDVLAIHRGALHDFQDVVVLKAR